MRHESKQPSINKATVRQKTRRTADRAASAAGYAPSSRRRRWKQRTAAGARRRGGRRGGCLRTAAAGGSIGIGSDHAHRTKLGGASASAASLPAGGQRGPPLPDRRQPWRRLEGGAQCRGAATAGWWSPPNGCAAVSFGRGAVVQSGARAKWKPRDGMNGATLSQKRTSNNYPLCVQLVGFNTTTM